MKCLANVFHLTWLAAPFAGLVLVAGACHPNETGNLGSTRTGDMSNPARRESPVATLQEACGAAGSVLDGSIHRHPYLQQVTTSAANIGWVSVTPEGEQVRVTSTSGDVSTMVAGQQVTATVRRSGEQQMWARIEGLQPDTIYCYQIERDGVASTERIGFRTAPTADTDRTIGFLAFGDSGGGGSDQRALLEQMTEVPYELIVHTGDLAYDSGTIAQIEDTVFSIYADLFRHIPFYPAAGNHDYKTSGGAPFRDVFALPENADGNGVEQWYSYDWGRIHFVALDTESDYERQVQWLDRDLAATTLPWKVIYLHRPPYSSGTHGSDTSLRGLLAPVAERHGVQLVLAGHDHNYERMKPQNGVNYIVTGGGGVGTRSVGNSAFTEISEDVIHYVYAEVGMDRMVLHAIDGEGTEFDSVVIER